MPSRVVSGIRRRFQRLSQSSGQIAHVLLTRSPLIQQEQAPAFIVRLACVKHAASVHPEPGSNSPLRLGVGRETDKPVARSAGMDEDARVDLTNDECLTFVINPKESLHSLRTEVHRQCTRFLAFDIVHAVEFSRIGRS